MHELNLVLPFLLVGNFLVLLFGSVFSNIFIFGRSVNGHMFISTMMSNDKS